MDSPQATLVSRGGRLPHLCPNCAAYVVAATWSEHVSERCIRNVWFCEACGYEFETSAYFSVKPTVTTDPLL
jgi:ribosomal protein L37AE/L43A